MTRQGDSITEEVNKVDCGVSECLCSLMQLSNQTHSKIVLDSRF